MSFFNLSGFHSPPSRPLIIPSPTSPFCTSPSQLQEVTLDQDNTFSNSMGLKSPGGPMRGRSVKEFEEQLANLKKENFNLKLRIYFLEERMGVNFNLDKENIVKKNVELMVEVESLRKELQEKHDLLCQAVKAMELEDEEHKKLLNEKDDAIVECQQEIENLKQQLIDIRTEAEVSTSKSYQSGPTEYFSTQAFNATDTSNALKELHAKIRSLEEELNSERQNNAAFQIVLDQNDTKITSLTSKLEETKQLLDIREKDLREMASKLEEASYKYEDLYKKLEEKAQRLTNLMSENEELQKRQSLHSGELDKERKRYEKLKISSEQKITDLQSKLEASLAELKKSQELVVSKNSGARSGDTDADSFSVQKPATSSGTPQKDTFLLPTIPSPIITPTSSPSPSVNFAIDNAFDLKHIIEQLKTERDVQHQKIVKLKAEQMKACKIIKSMIDSRNQTNEEIANLKQKNEELEKELEGVVSKQKSERQSNQDTSNRSGGMSKENSLEEHCEELTEHYKALVDELDEKNSLLMATLEEKDKHLIRLQEEYEKIKGLIEQKEQHIADLELKLTRINENCTETPTENIEYYIQKLKAKDVEIDRLNNKLLQRNHDIQGLVNNELWSKNREIEKFQRAKKLLEGEKDEEIVKLKSDLEASEKRFKLFSEKMTEMGFPVYVNENGGVIVDDRLFKESENLRMKSNQVCIFLTQRLDELATFLDSLLQQNSVLGFLGKKENKRLREVVSSSLDVTRTLNSTLIGITPDNSIRNLTNASFLDYTESNSEVILDLTNVRIKYASEKEKKSCDKSKIIQHLRQQVINLKHALHVRDVELSKLNCTVSTEVSSDKEDEDLANANLNTTSTTLKNKSDNASDTDSCSEPDRSVSQARIGLLKYNSKAKIKVSETSTESTDDELDGEELLSKKNSNLIISELNKQLCDLEQKLDEKESNYIHLELENDKLKKELAHLEEKFKQTEQNIEQVRQCKESAQAQVQGQNTKVIELLTKENKDLQNQINKIEAEKSQALELSVEAEKAANVAKVELNIVETQLKEMRQQMSELEGKYENKFTEKTETLKNEYLEKVTVAEKEIKSLRNTILELETEYSTNYVKKSKVEEALQEILRLHNEVETLEERIEELRCEKETTNNKLEEYEEKINELRCELDNATLQYSEAVLEKTKIANEKALIEQEFNKSILKQIELKKQLEQVEAELFDFKQKHQRQVSKMETHKSSLEVRISELESSNAELHNRLIKIQAGCGDHISTSLPNTSNFVNQIVSFRRQNSENYGYSSEDQMLMDDIRESNRSMSRVISSNHNLDVERIEANSSPDLGIESDHGRFSSLETHLNVQRPLLQTLELTESMNNLLDVEANSFHSNIQCENNHCCQKTAEMANENVELKRKLLRTRRALEETVTQLTIANQRKKQVEKSICRQIHKTSQVLRKAKANLDSGSETDAYKK